MEKPWKKHVYINRKGKLGKGRKEQEKNKRPCTSWRRTRFLRKHSVHMHIPQKEGSAKIGRICETVRESENEIIYVWFPRKKMTGQIKKSCGFFYYYSLLWEIVFSHELNVKKKKLLWGWYQYARRLSYHSYNQISTKTFPWGVFPPTRVEILLA